MGRAPRRLPSPGTPNRELSKHGNRQGSLRTRHRRLQERRCNRGAGQTGRCGTAGAVADHGRIGQGDDGDSVAGCGRGEGIAGQDRRQGFTGQPHPYPRRDGRRFGCAREAGCEAPRRVHGKACAGACGRPGTSPGHGFGRPHRTDLKHICARSRGDAAREPLGAQVRARAGRRPHSGQRLGPERTHYAGGRPGVREGSGKGCG